MPSPFDLFVSAVIARHYHNHRKQEHSDIVSEGIFADLIEQCDVLRKDYEAGVVGKWLNVKTEANVQGRGRKIDLLVAGYAKGAQWPDLTRTRLAVENKSVITAHRNRTNRYDDLNADLNVVHANRPEAIHVATVLIGTAPRVLNIPDCLKKRLSPEEFRAVLPRLSIGEESLWKECSRDISYNTEEDIIESIACFRRLPTREPGHTHARGYDFVLIVPVAIDNVNPPRLDRENRFGINPDMEYQRMLRVICAAYKARWHMAT